MNHPKKVGKARSWVQTNKGVGVVLTAILAGLLVYLLQSPWVYREQRDGFLLGFIPLLSIVLMLACSLLMIFDSHKREIVEETSEAKLSLSWRTLLSGIAAVLVSYVYFQVSLIIGFLAATPLFLFLLMYVFGARPWKLVLIFAISTTVLIYLAFRLLGVELPSGIFPL